MTGQGLLRLVHEGRSYTVVECKACRSLQTQEIYDPVSPDYIALGAADIDEERLWCQGEHKLSAFRRWRKQALGLLGDPTGQCRLLDVGCGTGGFLSFARTLGFEVYGFDAAEAQVSHAARTFDTVRVATSGREYLEALGRKDLRFRVATLWDVLEHVRTPVRFLGDLRSVLEPGGFLFVSVPSAGAMRWKRMLQHMRGLPDGYGWAPWEHVFYHSPVSLALVHRQAGLTPVKSGTVACYKRPLSTFEVFRRVGFILLGVVPSLAPQIFLWSQREDK